MRPKKKIVLLTTNEMDLSLWRMRLQNVGSVWGGPLFHVIGTEVPDEAIDELRKFPECDLVVMANGIGATKIIVNMRYVRPDIKVLVFGGSSNDVDSGAYAFEPDGPGLPARVVERLRIISARKRGPKKALPLVQVEAKMA